MAQDEFEKWIDAFFSTQPQNPPWEMRLKQSWLTVLGEEKAAEFLIRLFNEPKRALEKFSDEQIYQGFWNLETHEFLALFFSAQISEDKRSTLFQSLFALYEKLFALGASPQTPMLLSSYLTHGYSLISGDPEDATWRTVKESLFDVFTKVLLLPNEDCQNAALDAIGNLNHNHTKRMLQGILTSNVAVLDQTRRRIQLLLK